MDSSVDRDDESPKIPIFVSPHSLNFDALDSSSFKQILTIYNPYDFPIRFKLKGTNNQLYDVTEGAGRISSKSSLDIIIRLLPNLVNSTSPEPLRHRIRVFVYDYKTKSPIGHTDVVSLVHFGASTNPEVTATDGFQRETSMNPSLISNASTTRSAAAGGGRGMTNISEFGGNSGNNANTGGSGGNPYSPNYVAVATAVICIASLMLPTSEESGGSAASSSNSGTVFPTYLQLSVNQKLLAAYALGLATFAIFRG